MPTTNYIWDELNCLAEADGSNTIHTVYSNEPREYGNLISSRISGSTTYHHFDGLGSTRQLTNAAGSVTDTVTYDAWGNPVSRTGTTPTTRLWVGVLAYYTDPETGLIWVLVRPYGPVNGRWTSSDPAGWLAAANTFAYSGSDPVGRLDASGRQSENVADAQNTEAEAETCTIQLCTKDVAGLGGHSYLLMPRTIKGEEVQWHFAAFPSGGKGEPKECKDKKPCIIGPIPLFGQLLAQHSEFKAGNPDYPKNPIDRLTRFCADLESKLSCEDLYSCFAAAVDRINKCCIQYSPTPVPKRTECECNSNCAARWLLESCEVQSIPAVPDPPTRILPGWNLTTWPIPACANKAAPGKPDGECCCAPSPS